MSLLAPHTDWGLRSYKGLPDLIWGNQDCQHDWNMVTELVNKGNDGKVRDTSGVGQTKTHGFCSLCGAWKGQLGQEPTPELYISHLVQIFQEVKRVLRSDGVCFVNIGDSYMSHSVSQAWADKYDEWQGAPSVIKSKGRASNFQAAVVPKRSELYNLKDSDKCLIPFRLAIALQEDGWWVRQDIIWHKPNPMPESVSSPRWVKHRVKVGSRGRSAKRVGPNTGSNNKEPYQQNNPHTMRLKVEDWRAETGQQDHDNNGGFLSDAIWQDCPGCEKCLPNDGLVLRHGSWRPTESHEFILMLTKSNDYYCDGEAVRETNADLTRTDFTSGKRSHGINPDRNDNDLGERSKAFVASGRNLRSVWSFSTQSYAGAHYATFPEKLPELCIKAGTSEYGVCAECGKPYARIIKTNNQSRTRETGEGQDTEVGTAGRAGELETQTLGWRATCSCHTEKVVGAIVLDPFCGTSTTLAVAKRLGRQGVGYELSESYCQLSTKRLEKETAPMRL